MDHAHMDHGDMSHSDMGRGGMGNMCSMNMLFTWDTTNLCIVFRQWHIRSTTSLVLSLLAVMAITAGYEGLREGNRRYEAWMTRRAEEAPRQNRVGVTRQARAIKAVLYAVQNFYSLMIMLIFMTYNGWVMVAVVTGQGLGYYLFGGQTTAVKETACH